MMPREDNKIRRFFTSRVFLVIALIVAIAAAIGFGRAYFQNYQVNRVIEQLQNDVGKLENKKLESMRILKYVMSQNFVEQKARAELNMKKPGERVAIINRGEANKDRDLETAEPPDRVLNNPAKWWYYFTTGRSGTDNLISNR
ncbi:MAG: septum formation initiator family protein [Patescibacteria group bacterium]